MFDKEDIMKNFVREMNNRSLLKFLGATSFSDEDAEVCTPACRAESLRRKAQQSVYRAGTMRY